MPSYDPKANRPRLVPVESADEAPVDALLGPTDAAPPLSVVPDPAPDAPAPEPVRRPAVAAPVPTAAPVAPAAPTGSSGLGARALAAAAIAAGVLACFVAWRGFARRRADG